MNKCLSFQPQINEQSRILILGSMPGVKSLEEQQYYAHPQNRFWKIIGLLTDNKGLEKTDYKNKIEVILNNNFALWDVIKQCSREGSLDSAIQNETPNNIQKLLEKFPNIKIICLNGNKAYSAFKKYFPELLTNPRLKIYKMPSTSPANARFQIPELIKEWMVLRT